MKRLISFLLCFAMLIGFVPMTVDAAGSDVEFYGVSISAGDKVYTEKAIVSGGEIYIPAESFDRYTRYEYDEDTYTFAVKGQVAEKAFKIVRFNPETKRIAAGQYMEELSDCFVVDGTVYLPLAQMLPMMDADILAVSPDVILITNNKLSMAELLYDFDMKDYAFDPNVEFENNKALAMAYILPSYWFSSIKDFRWDRLDFIFRSADYNDFKDIMTSYLKDDELFRQAMEDPDAVGTILDTINRYATGSSAIPKNLNDVYSWVDDINELNILDKKTKELIGQDKILSYVQANYGETDGKIENVLDMVFGDKLGDMATVAQIIKLANYGYTYFNHVEDNLEMLDAVYDVVGTEIYSEPERKAAYGVYTLFHEKLALMGVSREIMEDIVKKQLKDPTYAVYKGFAQLTGGLMEIVIPGNTDDVSKLMYHVGIVNSARVKAVAELDTEEETERFRLSLLLTMIASRKCYTIMAETAEAYGYDSDRYRDKIDKIENLIKGLYLVADNVIYDTCEYYDTHAELALERIEEGGILENLTAYQADAVHSDMAKAANAFLKDKTEYTHYAVVDIDDDSVAELLAAEVFYVAGDDDEQVESFEGFLTLFLWNGTSFEEYDGIYMATDTDVVYLPNQEWIVMQGYGTSRSGYTQILGKNENDMFCTVTITESPDEDYYGDWITEMDYDCPDSANVALQSADWYLSKLGDYRDRGETVRFNEISRDSVSAEDEVFVEYLQELDSYCDYSIFDFDGDNENEMLVINESDAANSEDEAYVYGTLVEYDGEGFEEWGIDGEEIYFSPEHHWVITRSDYEGLEYYSVSYKDEEDVFVKVYLSMVSEGDDVQWEMSVYSGTELSVPEKDWFLERIGEIMSRQQTVQF